MESIAETDFAPEEIPGVVALNQLTDNERFSTWKVEIEGEAAFLKFAKTNKTRQRLANEVWGNQTMAQLAQNEDAPFRVPEVLAHDARRGWLLTEFIDGQPLSPADYPKLAIVAAQPTLLKLYAYLDQAMVPRADTATGAFVTSKSGQELKSKITGKLEGIPEIFKQLNQELVSRSLDLIQRQYQVLTPAFAHSDLTPKHVVERKDGKPYIFDFEACSLYWPRFYELINYTTKLNIVHGFVVESDNFISEFFKTIGEDSTVHDAALKVVTASRTLLIVHELASPPTNKQIYNTGLKPEHRQRVESMLERCLSENPLI